MSVYNWDDAIAFENGEEEEEESTDYTSDGIDWGRAEAFEGGQVLDDSELQSSIAEMDIGSTNEEGAYTPGTYEEGGQTASPQDMQFAKDEELKKQMGDDIESITGATTSMYDNFKGDTKAFKKKEKAVEKLIEEKYGIKIEMRGGKKYLVRRNEEGLERAIEYPEGGNVFEALNAARGETGGAIAGAQAGAIAGGMVGGPLGAFAGGIIGGGLGAYGGAGMDVERNAEKMDIEVSEKEKSRLQRHAGVTDAAAGVVLGAIGKILSPSDIKYFTTIADMPRGKRKAVENLARESKLSLPEMEKRIKDYAFSTDTGKISDLSAVEGAAKTSEKEQTGFMMEAMKDSPLGKGTALEETTKRTEIIEDALAGMDNEFGTDQFSQLVKKHTMDDEGRRKATDWKGLAETMKKFGFEDTDPIYERVLENSKTFGTKETDIFQGTVRPAKPEEKAIPMLDPFINTSRGAVKSQGIQGIIESFNNQVKKILPGTDLHTIRTIKKALEEVKNPKGFRQDLLDAGIDKHIAEQVSKAYDNAMQDNAIFDAKATKTAEKEAKDLAIEEAGVDKARKKIVDDATKNANQGKVDALDDWKADNVVPTDLGKKLTLARKRYDWDTVEDIKAEILKRATDKEEAIQAGIKTAKKEKRVDVLKKGTEAKTQIKSDYKDMKEEEFVDAEVAKKTAKQEKRKGVIEKSVEQKTKRAEAKAKVEATAQKEADDLAVATRKQRTKEVTSQFEKDAADWEDANHVKGFTKRYGLAKRDYKKAIGTEDEAVAKKEFDSVKKSVEEARAKEVAEATAKREAKSKEAIAGGTKQTEIKIDEDGTVDLGELEVTPEDVIQPKKFKLEPRSAEDNLDDLGTEDVIKPTPKPKTEKPKTAEKPKGPKVVRTTEDGEQIGEDGFIIPNSGTRSKTAKNSKRNKEADEILEKNPDAKEESQRARWKADPMSETSKKADARHGWDTEIDIMDAKGDKIKSESDRAVLDYIAKSRIPELKLRKTWAKDQLSILDSDIVASKTASMEEKLEATKRLITYNQKRDALDTYDMKDKPKVIKRLKAQQKHLEDSIKAVDDVMAGVNNPKEAIAGGTPKVEADNLDIKGQSSLRTDTIRELGHKALNDFESRYKLSGVSGKWAEKAMEYGRTLTGKARRDFDTGLEEYYTKKGSRSNDMQDYLEGKPARQPKKKKEAIEANKENMTEAEIIISQGFNSTAKKARKKFIDDFSLEELKEAVAWQAENTGKGLRDSPAIRAKVRAMKKKK